MPVSCDSLPPGLRCSYLTFPARSRDVARGFPKEARSQGALKKPPCARFFGGKKTLYVYASSAGSCGLLRAAPMVSRWLPEGLPWLLRWVLPFEITDLPLPFQALVVCTNSFHRLCRLSSPDPYSLGVRVRRGGFTPAVCALLHPAG